MFRRSLATCYCRKEPAWRCCRVQRRSMRNNFDDPRAFKPERWLGPNEGAHDVAAHTPFGAGPRFCPGRALALVEMKALLSMLYKNFEIERIGARDSVSEAFGFTMSPEGLRLRLRRRPAARAA